MDIIGLQKERKSLEMAIKANLPTLLIGETGLGKTSLVASIANKYNKKLVRFSLNGEVGINEFLGQWLITKGTTYWQDGVIPKAMREGYWVVLDEVNMALPEVLACLNSIIDDARSITLSEKDGEVVEAHPDFRLFACINPCDEYTGTKELNKALVSRFAVVIRFNAYKPEEELEIIKQHVPGINEASAKIMVDVANLVRSLKKDNKIFYTCSPRDVIFWAKAFSTNGHSLRESFQITIANKSSEEDREHIQESISQAQLPEDFKIWNCKQDTLTKRLSDDVITGINGLRLTRKRIVDNLIFVEGRMEELRTLRKEVEDAINNDK